MLNKLAILFVILSILGCGLMVGLARREQLQAERQHKEVVALEAARTKWNDQQIVNIEQELHSLKGCAIQ